MELCCCTKKHSKTPTENADFCLIYRQKTNELVLLFEAEGPSHCLARQKWSLVTPVNTDVSQIISQVPTPGCWSVDRTKVYHPFIFISLNVTPGVVKSSSRALSGKLTLIKDTESWRWKLHEGDNPSHTSHKWRNLLIAIKQCKKN